MLVCVCFLSQAEIVAARRVSDPTARAKADATEFGPQERSRVLELLLSKERVVNLLYDRTFPSKYSTRPGASFGTFIASAGGPLGWGRPWQLALGTSCASRGCVADTGCSFRVRRDDFDGAGKDDTATDRLIDQLEGAPDDINPDEYDHAGDDHDPDLDPDDLALEHHDRGSVGGGRAGSGR